MKKRFLSMLLAFAMVLTIAPVSASAEALDPGTSPDQSGLGSDMTETYVPDADMLPDNDELFAGYVYNLFYGDINVFSTDTQTAGSKLDTATKKAYDSLVAQIKEVAAGRRKSTVFTVEGLSDILNVSDSYKKLINAVLADCPFELFWFDKTKNTLAQGNQMTMYVAKEYSRSGTVQTTEVMDGLSAVTEAKTNADKIITDAKNKTAIEKLIFFKNEICNRVSYNNDAAYGSNKPEYGNPWQMIWVFDNDTNNQVVCEGYAKAFQYLCDESFKDGSVQCYTVTGDMDGGGHMWNIVTIGEDENGKKNYLVDVTNCDGDSIGAPDWLFMAGYDSGSVESGYTFYVPQKVTLTTDNKISYAQSSEITYQYDSNLLWDTQTLTLSDEDYVKNPYLCYPAVPETLAVDDTVNLEPTLVNRMDKTYTYSVMEGYGALPGGLTIDASTGIISGDLTTATTSKDESGNLIPATVFIEAKNNENEVVRAFVQFPVIIEATNPKLKGSLLISVVNGESSTTLNGKAAVNDTLKVEYTADAGESIAEGDLQYKWYLKGAEADILGRQSTYTVGADASDKTLVVEVSTASHRGKTTEIPVKILLTDKNVSLDFDSSLPLVYDGTSKDFTVKFNKNEFTTGNYEITYSPTDYNLVNAGDVTATITGTGPDYSGSVSIVIKITAATPEYSRPTGTATVGDPYPVTETVQAEGVTQSGSTKEEVPGTLTWYKAYTDEETNTPTTASDTFAKGTTGQTTLYWVFTPTSTNYKAINGSTTFTVSDKPAVGAVEISGLDNGKAVYGDELTATVKEAQSDTGTLSYQWYCGETAITGATGDKYTVQTADIGGKLKVTVTGDSKYDPATSAAVDAVAITTAVTLNLTKNPIEVGETTAANVTVTPTNSIKKTAIPSTTVTFTSSDTSVATVDPAGNVKALKAGTTNITATFPKQTGYEAATSEVVTLEVTKKSLEACTFAITLNQDSFPYTGSKQEATVNSVVATLSGGDPVTLAATDYKVSYEGDSTNVGTITVKITPAENGSYTWTTPKTKTYTITQATFASEEIIVPVKNVAGSTATKDLTKLYPVTQSDAGTVAYTVTGGTDVDVTVESGILTLTVKNSPAAGSTETITVATTALKNYSTATFTIKVQYTDKTPVTITVTPAANLVYDGTAKTATASGAPDGVTLEYSYSGVEGTTYGPLAEAPINAGKYSVTAKIPDTNTDYAGADTVNFEIVPKPVTVKAKTVSVNVGDPMPALYEVEGLVGSDTFVPTVTGAPENTNTAGEFPFTVSGADTSADGNYSITYEPASGKVTVAKQTAATPTATPENRTFTGSVDVTLNCTTPGAKIYYVTDTAKDPAIEGTEFTTAITLTETTTIKAIAKVDGMNNSEPLEVTYTKQTPIQPPVVQQVATPVINPAGGGFYGSQQVTITCATPGATIYYSVDGAASQPYVGSFTLYNSATVTAYATFSGMTASNPATAAFTRYTYTPDPTPDPDPDPEPDNNYEPPVSNNNNNSNNSSNSSNSSTTQPTTPTQPETPTVPEVTARPEATVEKLVEQAVSGKSDTLVIAPVIGGDVTKTEVTLPASAASAIANSTNAQLKVETPVADVTIPNESLTDLSSQGAEIAVTAEKSEDGGVDVAVVVDGQRVENVPIKAAIPTPCGPGTVAKIVDANGNVISTVRKSSASGDGQTMNVPLDGSAKVVFVDSGKSFPDVPATNWAADAVAFASSHELMNGVNEETFSPSTPMTRGMLAVVLHNLEGNPGASYQGGFSDVTGSAWYAEAVQWASEKKVVTGLSDGVFAPDAPITREQLVVMLYRYMGEPAVSGSSLGRFSDSGTVSDWAAQAMSWAVANGVVNGSNGALNPQGSATRAEVAQMLMNFVSSGML